MNKVAVTLEELQEVIATPTNIPEWMASQANSSANNSLGLQGISIDHTKNGAVLVSFPGTGWLKAIGHLVPKKGHVRFGLCVHLTDRGSIKGMLTVYFTVSSAFTAINITATASLSSMPFLRIYPPEASISL